MHQSPDQGASSARTQGQMELFGSVLAVYAQAHTGVVGNERLYAAIAEKTGDSQVFEGRAPVGRAAAPHNLAKRKIRWYQQTLKQLGLIERVPGERGVWQVTPKGRAAAGAKPSEQDLEPAVRGQVMLGFSTELGIALWGDCADVFSRIDEPIHCLVTSTPYPLAQPRAYGNPTTGEFVDFICRCLEPVVRRLAPGGALCVNVSNDIFLSGLPARSSYRERMLIALEDRLGLFKMDELIWYNRSKAPGPVAWASKQRMQLNVAWEPIYWLTNDPARAFSSNQRVLRPHSESHRRLIEAGGEQRQATYGDGANRLRPGAFSRPTAGTIPKNVLEFGHRCGSQQQLRAMLQERGLPVHSATMPLKLARFLVDFLTSPGQLVVDTFGGWCTTALAAQEAGRRWIVAEKMRGYLEGAALRFQHLDDFERGPAIAT